MADRLVDDMVASARALGPFRRHPSGELYAYAEPSRAEAGEPSGIYVPAEDLIRRHLVREFPGDWKPAHRQHVLEFLRDESFETFRGSVSLPLIPTLSGVLDLTDPERGVQVLPHSPHYGFTSQVPHEFDPDAVSPETARFLRSSLPEDAIDLYWELAGYTLLPLQFFRKAVLLTGPSGTGKSTLLSVLSEMVGPANVARVPLQSFDVGKDRFAASSLYGRLANIGGDLDATQVEATGAFKSLTGDDVIRADVKYGKPIDFQSYATCWFAANEVPQSRDHSDAWRERWVILPFTRRPAAADPALRHRLTTETELRGALRHAVEGVQSLLARGRLSSPPSVREAADVFAVQTDHVQHFLRTVQAETRGFLPRADLTPRYRVWATDEGVRTPVRKSLLLQRAEEMYGPTVKRQGDHGWNIQPAREVEESTRP